ncbi:hypothetical protein H6G27_09560 [Nostoc linckia FACHB-104]|nr:hypothetical protein [Nostoc linckia FACHB-104]
MSSFLQEELGVASSGTKWDVAGYKLWQSSRDDIILFSPAQALLAKGADGRYQSTVSVYNQQVAAGDGNTTKITGGSAVVSFTSAIQFDPKAFEQVQEQWRAEVLGSGKARSQNPKFVALSLRKGEAIPVIDPVLGTFDQAHSDKDIGTSGSVSSYLLNLTELGAQVWADGIKNRTGVPGAVLMKYQYLQLLPRVGARVTLDAKRAFSHLSTALDVSYDGLWYGGSAKIDAAWERMTREGIIKIDFFGAADPEVEKIRQDLVNTFSQRAQDQWFKMLFEPKPVVKAAEPGKSGGVFGGANFALKWRSEQEAINLALEIGFNGWTMLTTKLDAPFTMLSQLDASYVNETKTQESFPAKIIVDPDEQLQTAAISWSASEGKSPEAPVFGETGGTSTYVVTSRNANNVKINYQAKISYKAPKWPVIETKGSQTVAQGGNQIVLKTSSWVGRHMIYMFIREGDTIVPLSELSDDDYLVANVSYSGAHLRNPVKDSARITPLEPLEFAYPLSPAGDRGQAKFSAFGVIQGKLVRSKEQNISFDEEAVFILASKDSIQLVSQDSVLPEDDALAQSLLEAGHYAVVKSVETERETVPNGNGNGNGNTNGNAKIIAGTLVAVEYNALDAALWIESEGTRQRVRLHNVKEADPFDDEGRKQVKVLLDDSGEYAQSILVELGA